MYKIEKTDFGFKLTFADKIPPAEMRQWYNESREILTSQSAPFYVFVDMRTLQPLGKEERETMEAGQKMYKDSGMERSVVILKSMVIGEQFKHLAKKSGIYEWERYIISEVCPEWEQVAMDWLIRAVDPDVTEPA
ncbi:MAG: hypothetical protein R3F48_03410 [Candidatus Zixiibacteriota bacterium]